VKEVERRAGELWITQEMISKMAEKKELEECQQ
jgi:hypothetical protein